MLAARYYGPKDIRVENIADPVCSPGKVLVKIAYAGICGSDMHNYRKGMFMTYAPETVGHEFSGTVIEVGEGVKGFTAGMKVVGDPRVSCGKCEWCAKGQINLCPGLGFIGEVSPGCFAKYLLFDPAKLIVIPEGMPLLDAAVTEPLAVAVHILRAGGLSAMKKNQYLGLIGAGPIGLLTLLAAKALLEVRTVIVDISAERLKLAERLGADKCMTLIADSDENSIDAVVEAVGLGVTLKDSLRWLKPKGKLVMAGLYEDKGIFDPNPIVTKELQLIGINSYETSDLYEAVELISAGKVDVRQIITDIVPLDLAVQAFSALDSNTKNSAKVIISPDSKNTGT